MIQRVLSRRSAKIPVWLCSEYNLMSNTAGTFQHKRSRAAIVVIGDEILKGQVQDSNSHYIAKQLHSLGVKLDKISVIPDSVDAISREVRFHSEHYDFVITTGGIGPTHDDVTFQGVAAAFNDTTALRPEIQQFVSEYFKTNDITQPCFKLAQVPTSARLLYGEDRARGIKSRFPVVQVRNVYVFPGVPSLLERAFALLAKDQFASECSQFHCDAVYLSLDEVSIASVLNRVVEQYPGVTFGSYPVFYHSYYKTRISIEAGDSDMLAVARRDLTAALPGDALVNYNPDPVTDAWRHLQSLLDDQPHVRSAISVLQQCLQKYTLDEVCVCFNGGKDCTAVLHLLHALVNKDCSADLANERPRIRAVYIRDPKPFPEMEQFVQETAVRYNLDLLTTAGPMKPGLERMLQHWPALKACVMGTRQGDPHSDSMCTFHATDSDWPSLMRVNAILSWDYQQLWQFLRHLSLPYCSLYDRGYTSLGSVDNTLPNPSLQRQRSDGSVTYRPAHELADGSLERAGRIKAS